jgi:5-methylcytosine-specific restriction protein A
VTLRPCLVCGELADGPRCEVHTVDRKPPAAARGYDAAWSRLSKRARRLQPFCSDCGSTEDLQADHSPEAWERKAEGLAIRLVDVDVVCGPCNRRRGAARGPRTRGEAPSSEVPYPLASQSLHYTPREAV